MRIEVEPTWYINTMHFTAVFTLPINLIGVLIILLCETQQIQSLRWHLLTYQICSLITDFLINIGTLPVIFSPFPIGRPHGIFTRIFQFFGFQTSTEAQCIMVFTSIYITAGSVELLFFLRYQKILPNHHKHKLTLLNSAVIILVYQILHISFMIIIFQMAIPNQIVARAQFIRLYPDLQYLISDEHTFIVAVIVEPIHVLFLSTCFFRLGIGIITVVVLVWMSSRALHSFQLSTKTRKMHLQLINNLIYQISVPIIAFYGPVIVVIIPLIFSIQNSQLSFFISLICLSVHTCLGTCSMFYFNRPYRNWLISVIREKTLVTSFNDSKVPEKNNGSRIEVIRDITPSVLF